MILNSKSLVWIVIFIGYGMGVMIQCLVTYLGIHSSFLVECLFLMMNPWWLELSLIKYCTIHSMMTDNILGLSTIRYWPWLQSLHAAAIGLITVCGSFVCSLQLWLIKLLWCWKWQYMIAFMEQWLFSDLAIKQVAPPSDLVMRFSTFTYRLTILDH